jgi:hypothetical protein
VDPDLAGEEVVLWWGIFDNELYVERGEQRYGPYTPVGGPIPLHRYRRFKKTKTQRRTERIEALAELLNVRPAEIHAFLHGQLAPGRTQELHSQLLAAGLPV